MDADAGAAPECVAMSCILPLPPAPPEPIDLEGIVREDGRLKIRPPADPETVTVREWLVSDAWVCLADWA